MGSSGLRSAGLVGLGLSGLLVAGCSGGSEALKPVTSSTGSTETAPVGWRKTGFVQAADGLRLGVEVTVDTDRQHGHAKYSLVAGSFTVNYVCKDGLMYLNSVSQNLPKEPVQTVEIQPPYQVQQDAGQCDGNNVGTEDAQLTAAGILAISELPRQYSPLPQ